MNYDQYFDNTPSPLWMRLLAFGVSFVVTVSVFGALAWWIGA